MKDIPGYDDYRATDDGHIVRKDRIGALYEHRHEGYMFVKVRVSGRRIKRPVHQLVALAFMGTRPAGKQVRHLNGIATDNRPNNLVYGTAVENYRDAVLHGRRGLDELAPRVKLAQASMQQAIQRVRDGEQIANVAQALGITGPYLSKLVRGVAQRVKRTALPGGH